MLIIVRCCWQWWDVHHVDWQWHGCGTTSDIDHQRHRTTKPERQLLRGDTRSQRMLHTHAQKGRETDREKCTDTFRLTDACVRVGLCTLLSIPKLLQICQQCPKILRLT